METTTANAQPATWNKTLKAVKATRYPSGHQLRSSLSPNTIAVLEAEALSLSHLALISFASTKHPSRIELQEWINVNLVHPNMAISRIKMLQRGYFVLTFAQEGTIVVLQ